METAYLPDGSRAHRRQRRVHRRAADGTGRRHRRGPAREYAAVGRVRRARLRACARESLDRAHRRRLALRGRAGHGDRRTDRCRQFVRAAALRRAGSGRRSRARQLDDPSLRPQRHRSSRLHRRRPRRSTPTTFRTASTPASCNPARSASASTSASDEAASCPGIPRDDAGQAKPVQSEKFVRIGLPRRLTGTTTKGRPP